MTKTEVFRQLEMLYEGYAEAWQESVDDPEHPLTAEQADEQMTAANFLSTLWFSYFDDTEVVNDDGSLKEGALERVQAELDRQLL